MDGQGAETELREHSQNNKTRQKKAENEKVSSHEVLEKLSKMNKEDMKGGAAKMGFDQLMKYQRDCNSHSNWALQASSPVLDPQKHYCNCPAPPREQLLHQAGMQGFVQTP